MKVALLTALETPGGRIERVARQLLSWGRLISERGDREEGRCPRGGACPRGGTPPAAGRADPGGHRPDQGPSVPRRNRLGSARLRFCAAPLPRSRSILLNPAANGPHGPLATITTESCGQVGAIRCSTLPSSLLTGTNSVPPSSTGRKTEALRIVSFAITLLLATFLGLALPSTGWAVESVRVDPKMKAIDLTPTIERYSSDGDEIRISTAPGRDGIVRRIAVKAREAGTRPDWIVFALTNDTDEQVDRLLVAPHFRLTGSGVLWPDLGATRIAAITASQGIRPERDDSADADIFLITLDPGTTVTFVAELRSDNLPQLHLWDADAYKDRVNGLTLYKGIIIGIAGLLALFLTIVFVVKGALIFPRGRGPRLGGARLCLHRFRLLPAHLPDHRGDRADLPRRRGGGARRDASRLPLRLSQPQPLARALQPRDRLLASLPRRPRRRSPSSIRRWPRAWRACRSRRSPASASSS